MKWITAETTSMKLDYYYAVSHQGLTRDVLYHRYFILACLQLYKISQRTGQELLVSDRKAGDDVAILALTALHQYARAYGIEQDLKMLILLEHLLEHSKHNYDALLIAVQIYAEFGIGSLAMDCYSRLNIKNIQHASMPWILMTRISSIHPLPVSKTHIQRSSFGTVIDPMQEICTALEWLESAEEALSLSTKRMLDDGQYHMALETLHTGYRIHRSFLRFSLFFEGKRIARFVPAHGQKISSFDGLLDCYEYINLYDDRETSVLPNYECKQYHDPAASDRKLSWPLADMPWLHNMYQQVLAWDHMTQTSKTTNDELFTRIYRTENPQQRVIDGETTRHERWYWKKIHVNIVTALKSHSPNGGPGISAFLDTICESYETAFRSLDETAFPLSDDFYLCEYYLINGWEWLADRFLFLDMCNFSRVVAKKLIGQSLTSPQGTEVGLKAMKLEKLVDRGANFVMEQALETRQKFLEPRERAKAVQIVVNELPSREREDANIDISEMSSDVSRRIEEHEDHIGALLQEIVGLESIETAARDVIESCAEALYGLAEVAKIIGNPDTKKS